MGGHLKVDIDLYEKTRWEAAYYCLKALPYRSTYFHLTEHGVHICIPELPDHPVLRAMFGDDPDRMEMDEERRRHGLPTNVLFIAKNRHKVETTNSLDRALEWIEDL